MTSSNANRVALAETDKVIRFRDYERRSCEPRRGRGPTEPCTVIILPVVRIER